MFIVQKLQATGMCSFMLSGIHVLELVQFSQTKHFPHKEEFMHIHNTSEEC